MNNKGFDVAQICQTGHVINKYHNQFPSYNRDYCPKCGAKTVTACSRCNKTIPGGFLYPMFKAGSEQDQGDYMTPAYCPHCGALYPWTESSLQAAREYAEEVEGLSDRERDILITSLDDLIVDTPRTELSATRVKKIVTKLSGEAAKVFRDILREVAVEAAKRILWPQS